MILNLRKSKSLDIFHINNKKHVVINKLCYMTHYATNTESTKNQEKNCKIWIITMEYFFLNQFINLQQNVKLS